MSAKPYGRCASVSAKPYGWCASVGAEPRAVELIYAKLASSIRSTPMSLTMRSRSSTEANSKVSFPFL